ncbi:hypothetical protein [Prosthecobacter fluviatilis]|uniref:Uncharacterized protein n=1 Tax=Prosthecobacter fluviatilis TaxID=445931 RepID=A0ABW0KKB7_9BACT
MTTVNSSNQIKFEDYEDGLQATIKNDPLDVAALADQLAAVPNLKRIVLMQPISELKSLGFLEGLVALQSLHINHLPKSADCSALLAIPSLKEITTGDYCWFDCSLLKHIPNLKKFRSGPKTFSLNDLKACEALEWIELRGVKAANCSFVAGMRKLKQLRLWDCKIPHTDGLDQCPQIIDLDLGRSSFLELQALSSLEHLQRLELERCGKIPEASVIMQCLSLVLLNVSHCQFGLKGCFFDSMNSLEVFSGVGIKIDRDALLSLIKLPHLRKVSVSKCYVQDFACRDDLKVFGYK